ncbi:DNA-binding LacI/PurR family transcriptional regulator [Kineococcus xinjiangensis]|uniref:DNA-binding LacI/PurR family transcriptional regulator n=1 Tax=Kineococcus xinjiangensis TaxID=512762 RepID=A0A2S6IUE9_9ACTN|nr:LacI family DNA-binding transcriptional regulator [Kineococcus xinjiangensis]PPK97891.1 DNA-binding LacI/PurR family transcriptional regulator [Kineococcus xinjiangensis]
MSEQLVVPREELPAGAGEADERPRGRQVSIRDVARAAGVSVPTVSRVLTGAARVSPERRDRVLRAIESLNYRPSSTARALVSGRGDQVAVMTSETAVHGYSTTLKGVETAARAAGHPVVISVVESSDPDELERAVQVVLSLPLAGVVVLRFDAVGVAVLEALPPDVPVVAVSGEVDGRWSQAVLDEESAGAELTRHLLGLGHRTVHHVAVPPSRGEDGRTTGWRTALEEAGAPVPPVLVADSFEATSGVGPGRRLAADPDVTAVFCGNDEVAMGVIAGLEGAGRQVPGDISVVGFDDHPLAGIWRPGLTTVHQDFQALGEQAFALLQAQLDGDPRPALSSTRPHVVLRASAAARPGAGDPRAMTGRSQHLGVHIARPAAEVYAFASDPANLPRWAPGLGGPVVQEEGSWFVETPAGRARVTFVPRNEHGVLDHDVVTAPGETVHVPLRVLADGECCEVVLTLRRSPGTGDAEFERDAALVAQDLALLKEVVEGPAA